MAKMAANAQLSGGTVIRSADPFAAVLESIRPAADDPRQRATRAGLEALIMGLTQAGQGAAVSEALVDELIAEVDEQLSQQVDAILQHPDLRALERIWRSLKFLVDQVDFDQNILVEFVNLSKDDLLADFEDAPEVVKSGFYKLVYTAEYGQFGGRPVGAIIADYALGPGCRDLYLLQRASSVAAMAHAPFIAGTDSAFFGLSSWSEFPNLRDLASIFEMPRYTGWRAFRESEDARYAVLTLPGFLLRRPYGADGAARSFAYRVRGVREDGLCWGNVAFCLATRLADSFAAYRWCSNIIGPEGGGLVKGLPRCGYDALGVSQIKYPVRALISERLEFELGRQGFVALSGRKDSSDAVFYSVNSCLRPKECTGRADAEEAELNYRLSTQLPYMMLMNRLAHYIKVIQRENIGVWKSRLDLERELNQWIAGYVTEMDNPDPTTRSRRPLRMAGVTVGDAEGEPGWYAVTIWARPHFKYMGLSFTLSVMGKLDRL